MGTVLPCSYSYWGRMRPKTLSGCQTWEHRAECAQRWFQVAGAAGEGRGPDSVCHSPGLSTWYAVPGCWVSPAFCRCLVQVIQIPS